MAKKKLTVDEAKLIVKAKYPHAFCDVQMANRVTLVGARWYVIMTEQSCYSRAINSTKHKTLTAAWLAAAAIVQKEIESPGGRNTMNDDDTILVPAREQPIIQTIEVTPEVVDQFRPGYYRAHDVDDTILAGDLVYAYRLVDYDYGKSSQETKRVHFIYLDHEYTCGWDAFRTGYDYEPDGEAIRRQQMDAVAAEIKQLGDQEVVLNRQALAFAPHVTDAGDFVTSDPDTAGLALVPANATPIVAKKALATFRNDVAKLKNAVVAGSQRLQLMMKEQQAILKAKLGELTAGIQERVGELQVMVARAEEAIWTINLYLGKDEEIVVLRRGKPAEKSDPICVRQLVLFMDEECAASDEYGNADHGGIDAREIGVFDRWLLAHEAHLQQVLPESKGVVALKPRRHTKDYSDPWTNAQMAKDNKETYFLIRNGDNLYRIWTDFDVGYVLLASRDEFMDIFSDDADNDDSRVPLRPGSKKYMAAMDLADGRRKHYFRVALILQGLLDRTKIFQPLPVPRLNILDPAGCVGPDGEEYLRFIYDGDLGQMLPDGQPTYDEWFAEANKSLCVGQRVMGFFNFSYSSRRCGGKDTCQERLAPPTAGSPNSLELYTLECTGDKAGSFYFYYKRKDTIWRRNRWESGEAKVRARCVVYQDDDFILNFDAPNVTVQAMRYYINSRLNRHRYMDMIPLLKRAIQIKEREERDEDPFRQLLIGQIMSTYKVSHETAEEAIPELVRWWKFKNQTHRTLLADDMAALKMIVAEFDVRRRRAIERLGITEDELAQQLIETASSTNDSRTVLLVAHKKGNEYVVLVAENDENIFVTEQVWVTNRSSNCPTDKRVRLRESKSWRLVDTRWERWQVLSRHARWDDWVHDARAKGYLPDPERQRAVGLAEELVTGRSRRMWSKRCRDQFDADNWKDAIIPLAISLHHDDIDYFRVYYCDREAILPETAPIRNHPHEPSIAVAQIRWKRTTAGAIEFFLTGDGYSDHVSVLLEKPPWRTDYTDPYSGGRGVVKTMHEWDINVAEIHRQQKLYKLYYTRTRKLERLPQEATESITKQLDQRAWDCEYNEYLKEFGDPELWDEHKKTIVIKPRRYRRLSERFRVLIERGIDCNGLTLRDVFAQSQPLLEAEDALNKDSKKSYSFSSSWNDRKERDWLGDLLEEDANLVATHPPLPQEPLRLGDESALAEVNGDN